MLKLVGSSWPCYPLETTRLGFGPPHWLAMALGQTVWPSTSLAQVRRFAFPNSPPEIPPPHPSCLHLPVFRKRHFFSCQSLALPSVFSNHQKKKTLGACTSSSLSPLRGSCCSSFLLPLVSSTAERGDDKPWIPLVSLGVFTCPCSERAIDQAAERTSSESVALPLESKGRHTSPLG